MVARNVVVPKLFSHQNLRLDLSKIDNGGYLKSVSIKSQAKERLGVLIYLVGVIILCVFAFK